MRPRFAKSNPFVSLLYILRSCARANQVFAIAVEGVTSYSCSSPVLMRWWSVRRNDYISPLVEPANTTDSTKGSTKRDGSLFRPGQLLRVFGGFYPLPEQRYAMRFKASRATI